MVKRRGSFKEIPPAQLIGRQQRLVGVPKAGAPLHSDPTRSIYLRLADADTLHDLKSVSKSVASLAVGIAIDRGLIRSVDVPIFEFFPELSDLRSAEKDRILLVHALTMTMGLKCEEATPATGDLANGEARMNMAWDPCRYVLGLPVTAPAGQEFFYNTGALRLISAIVHRATGLPLDEFALATLFEPLGIKSEWARVRDETDAGGGLRLRPRDIWLRSANLYLLAAAGTTVRSFRKHGSTSRCQ